MFRGRTDLNGIAYSGVVDLSCSIRPSLFFGVALLDLCPVSSSALCGEALTTPAVLQRVGVTGLTTSFPALHSFAPISQNLRNFVFLEATGLEVKGRSLFDHPRGPLIKFRMKLRVSA
jgi:hypothetical protein